MTLEIWKSLFKQQWAPLIAGIIIGFVNTMLFVVDSPWAVFTGLRNWGLHLLELLPGFPDVAQISPLEHTSSVMNIAFLFGAFGAALLSREFNISIPPLREAIKGIVGGILMGVGATFARGCTIGGFYSSISAMSVSGLWMMLGLFIGVIVGLKYLLFEKRATGLTKGGRTIRLPVLLQAPMGSTVLLISLLGIPYYYDYLDFNELGVIFCFSAILGIANQRSRFCFVRAFREPFMTGDGEMTKAVVASFIVAIAGFAVIKFFEIQDVDAFVGPSSGWPATLGGLIFGIGMMLAGGCASGSLWRAGEGHIKLWLAVIFFALSAAATHVLMELVFEFSYINRKFLPEVWDSWLIALFIMFGVMYLWYWVASWNERTEKLLILK